MWLRVIKPEKQVKMSASLLYLSSVLFEVFQFRPMDLGYTRVSVFEPSTFWLSDSAYPSKLTDLGPIYTKLSICTKLILHLYYNSFCETFALNLFPLYKRWFLYLCWILMGNSTQIISSGYFTRVPNQRFLKKSKSWCFRSFDRNYSFYPCGNQRKL